MKGMASVIPAEDALRPSTDIMKLRSGAPPQAASSGAAKPQNSGDADPNALEPTIYRFILKHSLPQQLALLGFTLVSFPFLYFSLDLPKTIINRAIGGKQFPQTVLGYEFNQ